MITKSEGRLKFARETLFNLENIDDAMKVSAILWSTPVGGDEKSQSSVTMSMFLSTLTPLRLLSLSEHAAHQLKQALLPS